MSTLRAFTLVELIVVISILAILSTIGFISYSSYLVWARDSNRIAQISRISDALSASLASGNRLPLPEGSVELKNDGSTFAYQGSLGQTVLQTISYSSTALDPRDKTPFTYLTNAARNSFQILTHLEDSRNLTRDLTSLPPLSHQATAQYENRFIKVFGSRLWVVVEADTLTPIQQTGIAEFELTSLDTTRYRELQDIVDVVRDRGRGWIVQANLLTCFDPEGVFRCSGWIGSVLEADQYVLNFDTQGGNTLSSTLVTFAEAYGSLPVPVRPWYTFGNWFTAASGGTQVTASTTVTTDSEHTLFARWTPSIYTVAFDSQGGSSVASKSVTYDSTYGTLTTPTRPWYTFDGWYTESSWGTQITSASTVTTSSNHVLYAQWNEGTYTVSFNSQGGTSVASKSVTFNSTYGTLATPTRSGYTFNGCCLFWRYSSHFIYYRDNYFKLHPLCSVDSKYLYSYF